MGGPVCRHPAYRELLEVNARLQFPSTPIGEPLLPVATLTLFRVHHCFKMYGLANKKGRADLA